MPSAHPFPAKNSQRCIRYWVAQSNIGVSPNSRDVIAHKTIIYITSGNESCALSITTHYNFNPELP